MTPGWLKRCCDVKNKAHPSELMSEACGLCAQRCDIHTVDEGLWRWWHRPLYDDLGACGLKLHGFGVANMKATQAQTRPPEYSLHSQSTKLTKPDSQAQPSLHIDALKALGYQTSRTLNPERTFADIKLASCTSLFAEKKRLRINALAVEVYNYSRPTLPSWGCIM